MGKHGFNSKVACLGKAPDTRRLPYGSSITKCGTREEGTIFDSCRNMAPGQSWSFTFNEKGTWLYHGHSDPSKFGQIIVE